jgi:hypothetical protein
MAASRVVEHLGKYNLCQRVDLVPSKTLIMRPSSLFRISYSRVISEVFLCYWSGASAASKSNAEAIEVYFNQKT